MNCLYLNILTYNRLAHTWIIIFCYVYKVVTVVLFKDLKDRKINDFFFMNPLIIKCIHYRSPTQMGLLFAVNMNPRSFWRFGIENMTWSVIIRPAVKSKQVKTENLLPTRNWSSPKSYVHLVLCKFSILQIHFIEQWFWNICYVGMSLLDFKIHFWGCKWTHSKFVT